MDADGLYLKLVIHENFQNRYNVHNQVKQIDNFNIQITKNDKMFCFFLR